MQWKFHLAVGWLGVVSTGSFAAEYRASAAGNAEGKEDLWEDELEIEGSDELSIRFPAVGLASLRVRERQGLVPLLVADLPLVRLGRFAASLNALRAGFANDAMYVRTSSFGPRAEWRPAWAEIGDWVGHVGVGIQDCTLTIVDPSLETNFEGYGYYAHGGWEIDADDGIGFLVQFHAQAAQTQTVTADNRRLRRAFGVVGFAAGLRWQFLD